MIANLIGSGVKEQTCHCDRVMRVFARRELLEETCFSTRVGTNSVEAKI